MKHKSLSPLLSLLSVPLLALTVVALLGQSADAVGPVTPLDEEPIALSIDVVQQVTDHARVPTTCTVAVDRVGGKSCVETITDWVCPAGARGLNPLSEDAKGRLAPTYDQAIANPVSERAYLDTHCLLVGTRPMPVPAATAACEAGQSVIADSTGQLVCVFLPAPTAATTAPTVAFTG